MTTLGRTYGGLSAQQRAQERRGKFLEAGRQFIAANGVAPMTVDLICQRANVSKRYFYDEFTSKEELLDALAEDLYTRLWTGMQDKLTETPRPQRVNAALRSVIHSLASNPADARLYLESPGFPHLRQRQQRAVNEFSDHITQEAMPFSGPAKKSVNRQLATRALVAGTTDLIVAWLNGDIKTDEDDLIDTLTAVSLGAAERL